MNPLQFTLITRNSLQMVRLALPEGGPEPLFPSLNTVRFRRECSIGAAYRPLRSGYGADRRFYRYGFSLVRNGRTSETPRSPPAPGAVRRLPRFHQLHLHRAADSHPGWGGAGLECTFFRRRILSAPDHPYGGIRRGNGVSTVSRPAGRRPAILRRTDLRDGTLRRRAGPRLEPGGEFRGPSAQPAGWRSICVAHA